MGAIHIDVLTKLDDRNIAENASQLVSQYGQVGRNAGDSLMKELISRISSASPAAAKAISGITSAATQMGSEAGAAGLAAAAGIGGIGVAAVEVTKHLY